MLILTYLILAAFLGWAMYRTLQAPREGLLIWLVFTTLALDALPWHLMPVKGAAVGLQLLLIGLAMTSFVFRRGARPFTTAFTPYVLALIAFWLLVTTYAIFPVPLEYGLTKSGLFLIKVLLPLLALGMLGPFDRADCDTIAHTLVWGAVLLAANLLAFGDMTSDRVVIRDDAGPISVARVLGQGAAIAILVALLNPRERWRESAAYLACVPLIAFAMMVTGTRGPLFALGVSLAAVWCFALSGWRPRASAIGRLAVVGALAFPIWALAPSDVAALPAIKRLMEATESAGANASDRARIANIHVATQGLVQSSFLGVGTGGFATLWGVHGREYPHNVVLEVAVEQGVLGAAMLTGLAGLIGWRVIALARSPAGVTARALTALLFFALFNAMVSGDLPANAPLWVAGGLIWLIRLTPSGETVGGIDLRPRELQEGT